MCQNLMIFLMIVRGAKSLQKDNLGANELYSVQLCGGCFNALLSCGVSVHSEV